MLCVDDSEKLPQPLRELAALLEFPGSIQPHGGSQQSVVAVPGDLTVSSSKVVHRQADM